MKMTILRAVTALEMDVDWEHMTEMPHAEVDDDGFLTMYGKESPMGELFYVILDKEATAKVLSLGDKK